MPTASATPDNRLKTVSELLREYDGLLDKDWWRWAAEGRFRGAFMNETGLWMIPADEAKRHLDRIAQRVVTALAPFEPEVLP